jgi:hypothetical protein
MSSDKYQGRWCTMLTWMGCSFSLLARVAGGSQKFCVHESWWVQDDIGAFSTHSVVLCINILLSSERGKKIKKKAKKKKKWKKEISGVTASNYSAQASVFFFFCLFVFAIKS